MATVDTAWRDLTAALEGEVVLPGSPRYDEVRRPQIPRFHDVRPQAVVLCRTPEDVGEAIAFARRSGIEVAVRSGGHDFAGRSSGPGMVLDLTPMGSLEVSDGLATVGPGLPARRPLRRPGATRSHDPGRLRDGRDRRPGARRGPRTARPQPGAHVGPGSRGRGGAGRRADRGVRRAAPRGPVLGAARRGRPGTGGGHKPHAPHRARTRVPQPSTSSGPTSAQRC